MILVGPFQHRVFYDSMLRNCNCSIDSWRYIHGQMDGIYLSPGVSTLLSNEISGETRWVSAWPSAPGTAQPAAEPWLLLSQAQRNHYIGAVPGSRTPLTAVTTSRCSRGGQEALSQLLLSPHPHICLLYSPPSLKTHTITLILVHVAEHGHSP